MALKTSEHHVIWWVKRLFKSQFVISVVNVIVKKAAMIGEYDICIYDQVIWKLKFGNVCISEN